MLSDSHGIPQQRLLPAIMEERLATLLARCTGIGLCIAGAAGWISLLTWSVADPSLTHASLGATRNLLGPAGAIVSDLLLQMVGLAAVFLVVAPVIWGLELISWGRIPLFRLRVMMLPVAVLALGAGFSALPTSATWPLHNGFGGIIGDLIYNLLASTVGAALPVKAGAVAGLALFSGGLASLACCLGLGGRQGAAEVAASWPSMASRDASRGPRLLSAVLPGFWRGGRARGVRVERGVAPDLAGAWGEGRPARSEFHSPTEAPATRPGRVPPDGTSAQADPGATGGEEEAGLDDPTDLDSRRIAERFAPANGQTASAAPSSRGVSRPNFFGSLTRGRGETAFKRPSLNMLKRPAVGKPGPEFTQAVLRGTARLLEDVLADFGVKGEIKDIKPGPVITLFELEPARGTKSSRVIGLAEDIARSMSAMAVRVAVVPGRNVIGIELPNPRREGVLLREMFEAEVFRASEATLPLALGKSIGGDPVVVDLARMPHLLVAGTTGSGKSVGINAMVLSLLYKLSPADCRLLMIDPKMLELSVYNGIPHLLTPVVTDPHKAVAALNWAVREMEERYKRMARLGVRNIDVFNNRVRHAKTRGDHLRRTVQTGFDRRTGQAVYESETLELETMPYIVVVVDEFADLMIVAGKEIESAVQRLAQMARAAGIHLIMATQRPSVDIITGTIKANFPTRISFKVTSKVDSRTILNEQGAEQLLGQGDMLFSGGSGQVLRVHGPFVSDDEVESIAQFLREQGEPDYVAGVTDGAAEDDPQQDAGGASGDGDLYDKAVAVVLRDRKASTSYLQRRLSIGYNRAADLIERMEREGIVGPANGMGKREILASGGASASAA